MSQPIPQLRPAACCRSCSAACAAGTASSTVSDSRFRRSGSQPTGFAGHTAPRAFRPLGSRRSQHALPVSTSAAANASAAQQVADDLPSSREESIQQAAEALAAQLPKEKKGGKGSKISSIKKVAIDVPLADQSAAAAVQLVNDLLDELPRASADAFTVIFADEEAARLGGERLSNGVMAADAQHSGTLSGPLLIVGPTQQQVADVQEMLFGWRGGFAAVLNAEWDTESLCTDLTAFVKSFETAYCFGPLEIKGFFSKREGCVFKWAKRGSPAATPWHILQREGDAAWQVVGRQSRRPTAGDMEAVFYNAAAASSPLTKGVKFVKGLTGGGKDKK